MRCRTIGASSGENGEPIFAPVFTLSLALRHSHGQTRAMPPRRPAKKARLASASPEDDAPPDDDAVANASHLVSFLTGYDTRAADEDGASGSEDGGGSDKGRHEDDYDEDPEDEDEEDDSVAATPTKRGKSGLVGPAGSGSGRSTPASTPRKRKPATPKERKTALELPDDEAEGKGIIRPSRADAYFLLQGRSGRTSGNSYSALVRPLNQAQYDQYASSARSKGKSKAVVESLQEDLGARWDQWELELEEGFNLLFYGFGSKRRTLNRFISERVKHRGHVVVVNGHFPQLGIRDVLSNIEDVLSIPQDIPVPPSASTPVDRQAHRIYAHFLPPEAVHSGSQTAHDVAGAPLYLVIHNIDSPSLRSPQSLTILSLLASCPRIHLIASFDHIHTPLLFSAALSNAPKHVYPTGGWTGTPLQSRGFNWIYHHTTTFDDYDLELTYQRLSASTSLGGLSTSASSGISEEAALQILRSVPPMALRLLKLLLTRQLSALPPDPATHTAHPAAPTAPVFAVDNDTLQRLSREKFIAREEERFDALMGEFKDHGLVVQAEVDPEGRTGRWVWVPLGKAAVERVLETMTEVEV